MGFKVSWLGCKGLDAAETLRRLGLRDTGVWDEAREAPFTVASIPGGWVILWSNDFGYVADEVMASLSRGATVIGCQIHEGMMYAASTLYHDGERLWSVAHDAQEGSHDLQIEGAPPAVFEEIRDKLWAQQSADDEHPFPVDFIFDAPVDLAQAITGFRYDQWAHEGGEYRFHIVEPA
jgi:hypothetical protein